MTNKQVLDYYISDNIKATSLYLPKISNGSKLSIGGKISSGSFKIDQHFNWFQKLMWKLCFGVKVEDWSEEDER